MTSFKFNRAAAIYAKNPVKGHSLRGERYRYIYYEGKGLEELYDHQTDADEFNNIAYEKNSTSIVKRFRQELMLRVPNIDQKELETRPLGYLLDKGKVSDEKFKSIENLPLLK